MSKQHKRDDDQAVHFRILVGSVKDDPACYAHTSFLVPSERIDELCNALQNAKKSFYNWSIDEDTILTDVQNIPSSLAQLVRSFDTIPTDKQSESELLDWLIHGDDYFSCQYVVVTFRIFDVEDKAYAPNLGNLNPRRVAFEINCKQYEPFVGFCRTLHHHDGLLDEENSIWNQWRVENYEVLDRREFLKEFVGADRVVGEELFEDVKEYIQRARANNVRADTVCDRKFWAEQNQRLIRVMLET